METPAITGGLEFAGVLPSDEIAGVLLGAANGMESGAMTASQAYQALSTPIAGLGVSALQVAAVALAAVSIGFTIAGDMPDELKALYTAADIASATMMFIPGAQFFSWVPQVFKLFGLLGGGESGRERNIAAREAQDIALSQNIAAVWSGILPLGSITATNIRDNVALLQDLSGILKGRGIGEDPKLAVLGPSQLGRDLIRQLDALIGAGPFAVNFPRGGGLDSQVAAALSWHLGNSPYIGSPNDAPMLLRTLLYSLAKITGIVPVTPWIEPPTQMSAAWLATYPSAQRVEELAFQQAHGTAARSQEEWDLLRGVIQETPPIEKQIAVVTGSAAEAESRRIYGDSYAEGFFLANGYWRTGIEPTPEVAAELRAAAGAEAESRRIYGDSYAEGHFLATGVWRV